MDANDYILVVQIAIALYTTYLAYSTLAVNGGVKVQRWAEQKCSTKATVTFR
jgi:hypothetical protein